MNDGDIAFLKRVLCSFSPTTRHIEVHNDTSGTALYGEVLGTSFILYVFALFSFFENHFFSLHEVIFLILKIHCPCRKLLFSQNWFYNKYKRVKKMNKYFFIYNYLFLHKKKRIILLSIFHFLSYFLQKFIYFHKRKLFYK